MSRDGECRRFPLLYTAERVEREDKWFLITLSIIKTPKTFRIYKDRERDREIYRNTRYIHRDTEIYIDIHDRDIDTERERQIFQFFSCFFKRFYNAI